MYIQVGVQSKHRDLMQVYASIGWATNSAIYLWYSCSSGLQTAYTYRGFSLTCTDISSHITGRYATVCRLQQQVQLWSLSQNTQNLSALSISSDTKHQTYTYGILLNMSPNCIYLQHFFRQMSARFGMITTIIFASTSAPCGTSDWGTPNLMDFDQFWD